MSTNWDAVKADYETGQFKQKDLAEKHGIKLGTLKSKISRERWQKVATKNKDATNRVKGFANGNPSPKKKFTERNQVASKHNLFSRYIPKETQELMGIVDSMDSTEIIWAQIQIQFAAIIRAQNIMWVENSDDHSSEIVSTSEFGDSSKVAFAYEKQAAFLNAQSRAMSELRSAIKQFMEVAHEDDFRRIKLEVMQEQLTQLKQQNEQGVQSDQPLEIVIKRKEGRG